MIQRIQSIFLLLSGLGFAGQFVTDLATSTSPIPNLMADNVYEVQDSPILLGITILGIVVSIAAIFLFRNRPLQQKLSIFSLILGIFLPLVAFLLIYNERTVKPDWAAIHDQAGLYLMAIPVICGFLAYRYIGKDDKLVKSMDRLR
ncbi:MAG: DUF4293 domain-containing protein [Saprospiraceae bacterium]|nr:DUF4293 domain-containing protein [Saprospiraceae bacterium]